MALPKAVYDKSVPSQNLVTTITGIITLVLSILVGFGIITPEQSTELGQHTLTILNAIIGVWSAVAGIILIFKAKDV